MEPPDRGVHSERGVCDGDNADFFEKYDGSYCIVTGIFDAKAKYGAMKGSINNPERIGIWSKAAIAKQR